MAEYRDLDTRWESLGDALMENNEFSLERLLSTPERIKTGFSGIDALLGGGLAPGLVILGGSPGLGKSTLALCIGQNVAANGNDVLFYSLEMPRSRILAKLITRQNFENGNTHPFTADDQTNIEAVKSWSPDTCSAHTMAREQVAEAVQRLFVIEPSVEYGGLSVKKIAASVRDFLENRSENDSKKPLVIVDYLQILPPDEKGYMGNGRQVVEESLKELMLLAREEQLTVLLISSLSRSNYKTPIQIDSFKETGSIEYSADVLLGIQFSACHDHDGNPAREKNWNLEQEKEREPRQVEVVFLKQRYGRTGTVPFAYWARYDHFCESEGSGQGMPQTPGVDPEPPREKGVGETPAQPVSPEIPVDEKKQEGRPGELPIYEGESTIQSAPTTSRESRGTGGKCCLNNTMIAHDLRRGDALPGVSQSCRVLPKKGIVTSYTISAQLSHFDCNVADALYSIFLTAKYFSDQDTFSLRHILTALTGDSKQNLTAQKRQELRASIARLRETEISIDCREEQAERGKERKYRGFAFHEVHPFLSLAEREGNYYFPSYNLADVMPLFAYGEITEQIITFPARLLSTQGGDGRKLLNDTAESIGIKRFLIYRLEVIRNAKSTASARGGLRTISFDPDSELLRALGIRRSDFPKDAQWKQRCTRLRRNVELVLDHFVRIGYISSYTSDGVKRMEIKGGVADPWSLHK